MTKSPTSKKQQIQMTVSATFSTALIPTDVNLGTTVEAPMRPLAEPGETPFEANDELAGSLSLVKHDERLIETRDEFAEWVGEVRASMARTLELSKRLDDLLALPIHWFSR
jgi:hypothetical protein